MHVLTLPGFRFGELRLLKEFLSWPNLTLHIRKPEISEQQLRDYLSSFSSSERQKLIIHGYRTIAYSFGIRRIHYSSSLRQSMSIPALEQADVVSTSTHSWQEFNDLPAPIEMAFIGPVFSSISKPGYGPSANSLQGTRINRSTKAIALGGISLDNMDQLAEMQCDDLAFCGAIWQSDDPLTQAKRCYERLHEASNATRQQLKGI